MKVAHDRFALKAVMQLYNCNPPKVWTDIQQRVGEEKESLLDTLNESANSSSWLLTKSYLSKQWQWGLQACWK